MDIASQVIVHEIKDINNYSNNQISIESSLMKMEIVLRLTTLHRLFAKIFKLSLIYFRIAIFL
ncbi:hypothetical protein A9P85_15850 [Legionella pneumophila]|nr:hypothetical protein A9P85_15850 [Legionella pneumophila]